MSGSGTSSSTRSATAASKRRSRTPVVVGAASRRRAFLGVERRGRDVIIGFREEGQHTLVDLAECPVLDPVIVAAVPGLREIAKRVMVDREGGRLVVTKARSRSRCVVRQRAEGSFAARALDARRARARRCGYSGCRSAAR